MTALQQRHIQQAEEWGILPIVSEIDTTAISSPSKDINTEGVEESKGGDAMDTEMDTSSADVVMEKIETETGAASSTSEEEVEVVDLSKERKEGYMTLRYHSEAYLLKFEELMKNRKHNHPDLKGDINILEATRDK